LRIVSGKRPESTQVRRKLTALRHQLLYVNVSPGCRRIYATYMDALSLQSIKSMVVNG